MKVDKQFIMFLLSFIALIMAIAFFYYQSKSSKELAEKEFLLSDLARQNNQLQESLNEKIKILDTSLGKTAKDLNSKKAELQRLAEYNEALKEASQNQELKLAELAQRTARLAEEKKALEKKLETNVLAPTPQAASFPPPTLAIQVKAPAFAQIVQVNKLYQFVVFNAGLRQGVKKGDLFDVTRSGGFVGKVSADRIAEQSTAAGILPDYITADFQIGDQVSK